MRLLRILFVLLCISVVSVEARSLRFFGGGIAAPDADRVKIRIDQDSTSLGGPPADIGSQDFTLEFWMKAAAADNTAASVTCGANNNWINGNIVFDRDRYNQSQNFGLSIAGGVFVFGVMGDGSVQRTICGTTNVLNNAWHHVAIQRQRSDGRMDLYIDGVREAQATAANGPDGDISYPDAGVPGNFCGDGNDPCTGSDPFLVIGAEKHDAGAAFPSYDGLIDEVRLSNSLRYSGSPVTPPSAPFVTDANTVALYHMDEGASVSLNDTSGATGGPSPGVLMLGGSPQGPIWSQDSPFALAAGLFLDDFNRADNAAIGNSWIEKAAGAFAISGNRVTKASAGNDFRDNVVYRPSGENLLNVEASVQFSYTTGPPDFPQVFVRGQTATITTADTLDAYLLFVNSSVSEALLGRISGTAGFASLGTLALSPVLNTTDTFRLRLRATGANPVAVSAYVEYWDGDSWVIIGSSVVNDSDAGRIQTAGTVGFSGNDEAADYRYDSFQRLDLTAAESVRQSCLLGWDAPTLDALGGSLTDLADYRIYVSQTTGVLGTLNATVTAPTTQVDCTALTLPAGLSYVVVKARDTTGNESVISNELALNVTLAPPRIQHHRRQ